MMQSKLVLENGSEFIGTSFGADKPISGEVVFNTGMVGYPEALTDPSYRGQILVFTYPLIGNYGVPNEEFESDKIQVSGLVVADYSEKYSHWQAAKSLSDWLKEQGIPAISGIDTRKLTKMLRERGTMLGKIVNGKNVDFHNPNQENLVQEVSIKNSIIYNETGEKRIILIDCGVKNNIIRNLTKRNLQVIRVPYDYNFFDEKFDGLIISNGPGDPKMCTETIKNVRKALEKNIPTFGICLGNQILALAAGGNTYKLKYGHRSQNQPCIRNGTKRCYITTQNHGFAVDMKTLSSDWEELFVNANDGTNEGIKHKTKPFFSVQFHPEGHSGPEDTNFLFDEFVRML